LGENYKVAIVAAVEREVRSLLRLKAWGWRPAERECGGHRFRFFEDGSDIVLVCGGIGAAPARRAAEAVIALYAPTVIYSVGFAGALEPGVKAGDVFQPAQVIDAGDGSRVNLSEGKGVLVSFASIATPAQKARLKDSFGAQLVDMEAAAVARAAQARGVEFVAVKSISDEFDFTFPDMDRFVDSEGRFQELRFARFAILRPWLWWRIARLQRNSRLASDGLCDWLIAALHRTTARIPDPAPGAAHFQ
jgi:adenosylhomocysteine nucleosidase